MGAVADTGSVCVTLSLGCPVKIDTWSLMLFFIVLMIDYVCQEEEIGNVLSGISWHLSVHFHMVFFWATSPGWNLEPRVLNDSRVSEFFGSKFTRCKTPTWCCCQSSADSLRIFSCFPPFYLTYMLSWWEMLSSIWGLDALAVLVILKPVSPFLLNTSMTFILNQSRMPFIDWMKGNQLIFNPDK